jgi:hypothetical protein
VDFRACAEACKEEVDLIFECAVGKVWADVFAEVSDAGAREGCDCVAIRGADNGYVKEDWMCVYCAFAGVEHDEIRVDWVVVEGDEVVRPWRGSGGGEKVMVVRTSEGGYGFA